jgi:hypothetical protein
MNKTDLIKKIAKELYDSEEAYGEINAVATENEYEDVAERIVNKFFIHVVSHQRELLIAFGKELLPRKQHIMLDKHVDIFIEENSN